MLFLTEKCFLSWLGGSETGPTIRHNFGGYVLFARAIYSRAVSPVFTTFTFLLTDTLSLLYSQQATFSSASSLPLLVPSSAASHGHFPAASPQQQLQTHGGGGGGGMKLEAVMENLQRQQAARLALEEKLRQAERDGNFRAAVETHMQQQALAFRRYHASVRGALAGAGAPSSDERYQGSIVGGGGGHLDLRRPPKRSDTDEEQDAEELEEQEDGGQDDDDLGEGDSVNEGDLEEEMEGVDGVLAQYPPLHALHSPKSALPLPRAQQPPYAAPRHPGSPSGLTAHTQPQQHEWTYEEQFKQVRILGAPH